MLIQTAPGCRFWSPGPPGMARTSRLCRCWSRRRESAPLTISLRPGPGSASADTWITWATTCSWARWTPSPTSLAPGRTNYPVSRYNPSLRSPGSTRPRACNGSPSATTTTERAAAVNMPPCLPGCWARRQSSPAVSPGSTKPTSRSRAYCPWPLRTQATTTASGPTTGWASSGCRTWLQVSRWSAWSPMRTGKRSASTCVTPWTSDRSIGSKPAQRWTTWRTRQEG